MPKVFKSKEARSLMALTLAIDPTMAPVLRQMIRMGAHSIHPDYMLVMKPEGGYTRVDDPGAWNGYINASVGVSLLRGRDGVWFLNGF